MTKGNQSMFVKQIFGMKLREIELWKLMKIEKNVLKIEYP